MMLSLSTEPGGIQGSGAGLITIPIGPGVPLQTNIPPGLLQTLPTG